MDPRVKERRLKVRRKWKVKEPYSRMKLMEEEKDEDLKRKVKSSSLITNSLALFQRIYFLFYSIIFGLRMKSRFYFLDVLGAQ